MTDKDEEASAAARGTGDRDGADRSGGGQRAGGQGSGSQGSRGAGSARGGGQGSSGRGSGGQGSGGSRGGGQSGNQRGGSNKRRRGQGSRQNQQAQPASQNRSRQPDRGGQSTPTNAPPEPVEVPVEASDPGAPPEAPDAGGAPVQPDPPAPAPGTPDPGLPWIEATGSVPVVTPEEPAAGVEPEHEPVGIAEQPPPAGLAPSPDPRASTSDASVADAPAGDAEPAWQPMDEHQAVGSTDALLATPPPPASEWSGLVSPPHEVEQSGVGSSDLGAPAWPSTAEPQPSPVGPEPASPAWDAGGGFGADEQQADASGHRPDWLDSTSEHPAWTAAEDPAPTYEPMVPELEAPSLPAPLPEPTWVTPYPGSERYSWSGQEQPPPAAGVEPEALAPDPYLSSEPFELLHPDEVEPFSGPSQFYAEPVEYGAEPAYLDPAPAFADPQAYGYGDDGYGQPDLSQDAGGEPPDTWMSLFTETGEAAWTPPVESGAGVDQSQTWGVPDPVHPPWADTTTRSFSEGRGAGFAPLPGGDTDLPSQHEGDPFAWLRALAPLDPVWPDPAAVADPAALVDPAVLADPAALADPPAFTPTIEPVYTEPAYPEPASVEPPPVLYTPASVQDPPPSWVEVATAALADPAAPAESPPVDVPAYEPLPVEAEVPPEPDPAPAPDTVSMAPVAPLDDPPAPPAWPDDAASSTAPVITAEPDVAPEAPPAPTRRPSGPATRQPPGKERRPPKQPPASKGKAAPGRPPAGRPPAGKPPVAKPAGKKAPVKPPVPVKDAAPALFSRLRVGGRAIRLRTDSRLYEPTHPGRRISSALGVVIVALLMGILLALGIATAFFVLGIAIQHAINSKG